ncbi:MAG TPA: hypothetical protein VH481_07850 [Nitrososphaeraceae archaeon]
MSSKDQINRIKHLIYSSKEPIVQIAAIDALAEYGEQAINAITEIISSTNISDQVRTYWSNIIKNIRKESLG